MRVSNNSYNRYDSVVNNNSEVGSVKPTNRIKNFLQAFRVDLSDRALSSSEYNDSKIHFPIHNSEALTYTEKLDIVLK